MRELTDVERLHALMQRLGRAAKHPGRVYFTGGATALLLGWRATTADVVRLVHTSPILPRGWWEALFFRANEVRLAVERAVIRATARSNRPS